MIPFIAAFDKKALWRGQGGVKGRERRGGEGEEEGGVSPVPMTSRCARSRLRLRISICPSVHARRGR